MAPERWVLRVRGIVQGVGFRPAVWRLATGLGVAGSVRNTGSEVLIEIEGEPEQLAGFRDRLLDEAPPLARIRDVQRESAPPLGMA